MFKLLAGLFSVAGICFLLVSGILGAIFWPYTINSWLIYAGKAATVVWWQGFLLGFIPGLGQMAIVAAAITWVAMKFLM
jgi:hypothetical protein